MGRKCNFSPSGEFWEQGVEDQGFSLGIWFPHPSPWSPHGIPLFPMRSPADGGEEGKGGDLRGWRSRGQGPGWTCGAQGGNRRTWAKWRFLLGFGVAVAGSVRGPWSADDPSAWQIFWILLVRIRHSSSRRPGNFVGKGPRRRKAPRHFPDGPAFSAACQKRPRSPCLPKPRRRMMKR